MYIIPAIDLLDGKCVRLVQGEYSRYINYEDCPEKKAIEFRSAGAEWLHIIDLDGAKLGRCVNVDAVRAILAEAKGLKVQIGGGIRDRDTIAKMLDMGITRVIVGTKAVNDIEWLKEISLEFAGKVVLSLDARGNKIATHGWEKESSLELTDFVKQVAAMPLAAIIYTDINKDGMLAGANVERTRELAQTVKLPVIAAGGVTNIEDIKKLAETKVVAAAIVGRALYEGTMNLAEAIKTAEKIN